MTYLRRLWSDVSDADVEAAETLVKEFRQRHGATATAPPSSRSSSPAPANGEAGPASTLPPQYRSTPDPSFGSRSLAQRRERERLQRELIEAEALAAHGNASRRQEPTVQPPPGMSSEKTKRTGRPDA